MAIVRECVTVRWGGFSAQAVAAATDIMEGSMSKELKKFLKKNIKDKDTSDKLVRIR